METHADLGAPVKEYIYKPRFRTLLFGLLFCGGAAALFFVMAATNQDAWSILSVIHMNANQANIFFMVSGAIFTGGAAFCFLVGVVTLLFAHSPGCVLGVFERGILVPKAVWSPDTKAIRFADVVNIAEMQVAGQMFLNVFIDGIKKRTTIWKGNFRNMELYGEVKSALSQAVRNRINAGWSGPSNP